MVVTFQGNARQCAQLMWYCAQAGIDYELDGSTGMLDCRFDDITELMVWHRAFVHRFDWSPMDIEVMVSESEADF